MLDSEFWAFFIVVAGGLNLILLFYYAILMRCFPGEDPRIVSGRFSLRQQFAPVILAIVISTSFFFLLQFLGFTDLIKEATPIIIILSLAPNFYLNRRYGRLGANEEPPKIGKGKLTTLLTVLVVLLTGFMLLVSFLRLPRFYIDIAAITFFVLLIASIIWVRRSRAKGKLQ
jgi:purine-cytosine permease-like protein